jgi:hypothetical protein
LDTDTSISFTPIDTPYVTLRDIQSGERTFYAWAVDESNALSDSISHTWWVEGVISDILLVDDELGSGASLFYKEILESMGLTCNLWRIEDGLPYSPFDVSITINELGFNTIIWYTGKKISHLPDAQKPIERYLDDNKKLLLIGASIVNAFYHPDMPSVFPYRYLGINTSTIILDKVIRNGYIIEKDTLIEGYPDSLQATAIIDKIDTFEEREGAKVIYRSPIFKEEKLGIAVRCPAQNPNLVFFSVPLDKLNGLGNARDVVRYVLEEEFGLH